MINPSLEILLKKADCKYALVIFAAKRAREIIDGKIALIESESNKPVTIALEEIAQGKIGYEQTKTGIK
ncbi:MAG TPA: DNA-directed RNA polymerase subunit omega [Methylomusa anaerophila]|uniref:DNA-directed RNA polymerase subunit omega n=1 Tax=Methylomusa anaerophila TaxID=1930071 RepID=A0A348AHE3_9FIRM|nr:DNA-directed RNA polymerase subunit omega [Methylomusa anaerophila]BBB90491.1 DNA-directed RNA polymerase subunit omega [Methylomusa anaerophila]HML89866.1 DNA-directed RNA polymerase subunit omega [Methylomusa anaerophila]